MGGQSGVGIVVGFGCVMLRFGCLFGCFPRHDVKLAYRRLFMTAGSVLLYEPSNPVRMLNEKRTTRGSRGNVTYDF